MRVPVFIGDEVLAAAYRLAGVATHVPEMSEVPRIFAEVIREAGLVIISAGFADALPTDTLRNAVRLADPLILVVPDGGNRHMPEDLAGRVDRVLGIEP